MTTTYVLARSAHSGLTNHLARVDAQVLLCGPRKTATIANPEGRLVVSCKNCKRIYSREEPATWPTP